MSDKLDYVNFRGVGVKRVVLTFVKRVCYGSVGVAGRVLLAVGLAAVRGAVVLVRSGIRAVKLHAKEVRSWRIDSVHMGSFSHWQRPGDGWAFRVSGSTSSCERVCLVLCESVTGRMCQACPWSCTPDGVMRNADGRTGGEGMGGELEGTEPVPPP
jgi:hypothetical protein